MTHTRTRIVRSAFTFLFGILTAFASPAFAGTGNDAALVMDAESGRVLYARSGDALRSPASLTKMMTLYMLFDLIDAGKISLTDEMTASAHAAAQKPTKLGLKKGNTITVEQAIYSLVIQSANDAAVVIAEHISGSEAAFAKAMTKRARDLGMKRTTFRNASGLPDAAQLTTARDMAVLSRALMRNHPTLYTYFSTTSFTWNGKTVKTHNRVLTSLNGANGIKTGYTRASGFNLTTSAQRDGKRLIGVVLGGDSWAARDEEMRVMLEAWFAQLKRRPNLVASYGGGATVAKAEPAAAPVEVAMIVPKARAPLRSRNPPHRRDEADRRRTCSRRRQASRKEAAIVEVATQSPRSPPAKPARVAATRRSPRLPPKPPAKARPLTTCRSLASRTRQGARRAPLHADLQQVERRHRRADRDRLLGTTRKKRKSTGDWGIQIGAFDSRRAAATELDRARKTARRRSPRPTTW